MCASLIQQRLLGLKTIYDKHMIKCLKLRPSFSRLQCIACSSTENSFIFVPVIAWLYCFARVLYCAFISQQSLLGSKTTKVMINSLKFWPTTFFVFSAQLAGLSAQNTIFVCVPGLSWLYCSVCTFCRASLIQLNLLGSKTANDRTTRSFGPQLRCLQCT